MPHHDMGPQGWEPIDQAIAVPPGSVYARPIRDSVEWVDPGRTLPQHSGTGVDLSSSV